MKNCTNLDSDAHLWEEFFFPSYHMLFRKNKLTIPWQRNSLESTFPQKPETAWHRTHSGEGWDQFGSETLHTPSSSSQLFPLHHFSRIWRWWKSPTRSSALQHSSPKQFLLQSCCPYRAREHCSCDTAVTQPLAWRLMTFLKMTENWKSNCSIFFFSQSFSTPGKLSIKINEATSERCSKSPQILL